MRCENNLILLYSYSQSYETRKFIVLKSEPLPFYSPQEVCWLALLVCRIFREIQSGFYGNIWDLCLMFAWHLYFGTVMSQLWKEYSVLGTKYSSLFLNHHVIVTFYSVSVLEQNMLLPYHLNLGKACIPSVHPFPCF